MLSAQLTLICIGNPGSGVMGDATPVEFPELKKKINET